MTPGEQEKLESSLRQISPAAPPQDLMERLRAAVVEGRPEGRQSARPEFRWTNWFTAWRSLAVGLPAAAIMMILLWVVFHPAEVKSQNSTGIKADAVQVGHSLVASFDTVAQLPDGEPVRFRCREWEDDVVVHDDAHGVVITKRTPRIEVVPVRFETY